MIITSLHNIHIQHYKTIYPADIPARFFTDIPQNPKFDRFRGFCVYPMKHTDPSPKTSNNPKFYQIRVYLYICYIYVEYSYTPAPATKPKPISPARAEPISPTTSAADTATRSRSAADAVNRITAASVTDTPSPVIKPLFLLR